MQWPLRDFEHWLVSMFARPGSLAAMQGRPCFQMWCWLCVRCPWVLVCVLYVATMLRCAFSRACLRVSRAGGDAQSPGKGIALGFCHVVLSVAVAAFRRGSSFSGSVAAIQTSCCVLGRARSLAPQPKRFRRAWAHCCPSFDPNSRASATRMLARRPSWRTVLLWTSAKKLPRQERQT